MKPSATRKTSPRSATIRRRYATLVSEARTQGNAGDALVQSIVPRLKEKFGQWEFAEPVAKNNVLETDAEMSGDQENSAAVTGEF